MNVEINPEILLIAGVIIPMLTAIITKRVAHPGVKAITTLALSALAGGLGVLTESNGAVLLDTWLWGMLATWLTSIGAYYGLLKPAQVTETLQEKTAGFGLG